MPIESQALFDRLSSARLPSLPQVLLELLTLCDRDDVGMAEIGAAVAKDAGVAARLVGVANSPFYSPKRCLQDIDQCLAVLGTGTVRRLALNQAVAELFGRFQKNNALDLRYFWFHGLCVAVTARRLARHLGYANDDEAYLAGLLHDVGQLALLTTLADRYPQMLRNRGDEEALIVQEKAEFGVTHADVGAWLAKRWNLHSLFADSILFHHEPLARVRDAHLLVQIVALANLLNTLPEQALSAHEAALAFWKLDLALLKEMLASVQTEARGIAGELGVELPTQDQLDDRSDETTEAAAGELAEAVSQRLQGVLAQPETQSDSLETAIGDVLRGAGQIFAARGCALFMPKEEVLHWRQIAGDDPLGLEIRIPCDSMESRVAAAFRGRIGLAGLPTRPDNLADAQLLRLLDGERLLCLPLRFTGNAVGALAVALDRATVEHFISRQALLITFAREAGKCLGFALQQEAQLGAALRDASQRQEKHARNLIHEAGNPLGIVRNYISVLRMQAAKEDKTGEEFSLIENELRRVARILQQFKDPAFSTTPGGDLEAASVSLDINKLTGEVVQFCRLGKPELRDIAIDFNLTPDLPKLNKPGDSVKQILTNLLFNAAEAMGGKGRITLASALWAAGKNQRYVELSVSDNGPGLPAEVLANLYQPVQTRKGDGHAGLGLSIVAKLVEDLGGMLQCSSSVSGTQFKILLPLIAKDA